jgi:hypothetical protein
MCISLDIINGLTEGAYFRHPAFAHLTHLHILDPPYRWPNIPFCDLPSLTHLALQNYKTDIRSSNIPVLKKILSDCPMLEVLVVIIPLCCPEDQNTHNMKLLVDDPRLVILSRALNHRDDILGIPFEEKSTEHGPEKIIASEVRERLDSRPWATKVRHFHTLRVYACYISLPDHEKTPQETVGFKLPLKARVRDI